MTLMSQQSTTNKETEAPSPGASILTYNPRIHLHLPQDVKGRSASNPSTHWKSIDDEHQSLDGSSYSAKSFALLPVTAPGTDACKFGLCFP